LDTLYLWLHLCTSLTKSAITVFLFLRPAWGWPCEGWSVKEAQIKITSGLLLIVQLLDLVLYNNSCNLLQGLILVGCYTAYIGGGLPIHTYIHTYKQCFGTGCGPIFKGQAVQELLHNVTEEYRPQIHHGRSLKSCTLLQLWIGYWSKSCHCLLNIPVGAWPFADADLNIRLAYSRTITWFLW
jgi:hypothetical protein